MNPLAIPLPAPVRRRGEIVGIIAGLVCFPFALGAGALSAILPNGPAAIVLPIVMLSAIAGAIASATVDASQAPDIGGMPLRIGVRAGVVASLVAGGCTVLASTFHAFGIGYPAMGGFGWSFLHVIFPSTPAIVLALLSIPPSIFFGLTGALLAGMMKTGPAPAAGSAASASAARRETTAVFRAAIVLTTGCYFSPLLVALKPALQPVPKPAPIVAATPTPAPPKSEPATPPPPPPPKWRYQKPDGFDAAEAGRITVAEERSLSKVVKGLPFAMSPDGLRFACCRQQFGTQVQITDMETLVPIAGDAPPETPSDFAWSPDSKMLLILSEGRNRSLAVFDVGKAQILSLPLPRGAKVPAGRPIWWDTHEVIFAQGDKVSSVLNLETLRVAPANSSAKWKGMTDARRVDVVRTAANHLSRNDRWEMEAGSAVRSYTIPASESENWSMDFPMRLAILDRQKARRFVLPSVELDLRDALTASRDGTKLIKVHDDQATVYFLGLGSEAPFRINIAMPDAPDASLTEVLVKKGVAAFICAPVKNPLNGRTVAPDRNVVKAIARIASWQDKMAEFWIDERYLPVEPGDVLADLHTWDAGQSHQIASSLTR